jgi:hypothetical protein
LIAEELAEARVTLQTVGGRAPFKYAECPRIEGKLQALFALFDRDLIFVASHRHLDGGVQFATLAGFDQIAERATLKGTIQRVIFGIGGEENNGNLVVGANLLRRLNAIHMSFQVNVHQYQIRLFGRGLRDRLFAAGDDRTDMVAEALQLSFEVESDNAFVFDQHQIDWQSRAHDASFSTRLFGKVTQNRVPISRFISSVPCSCSPAAAPVAGPVKHTRPAPLLRAIRYRHRPH